MITGIHVWFTKRQVSPTMLDSVRPPNSIACPVVAIETPASVTPPDERAERVSWFGGDTVLVEVGTGEPAVIVEAIAGRVQ